MKTNDVVATISRSLAGCSSRRCRRSAQAGRVAIVAAGVALVSGSRAAPVDSGSASTSAALETDGALHTLERTCSAGDAVACNDLGVSQSLGYGGSVDLRAAARAFERSCSAGSPDGCGNLGALYESGAGVPVDLDEAARLYSNACDIGCALACSNLGALYARGRGLERDLAQAQRLFTRACETGSAAGCNNLIELTQPRS